MTSKYSHFKTLFSFNLFGALALMEILYFIVFFCKLFSKMGKKDIEELVLNFIKAFIYGVIIGVLMYDFSALKEGVKFFLNDNVDVKKYIDVITLVMILISFFLFGILFFFKKNSFYYDKFCFEKKVTTHNE